MRQPPRPENALEPLAPEVAALLAAERRAPPPPAARQALAAPLWDFATQRDGNLWLLTWFASADPTNWQEQDLWTRASFAYERQVAGHRALLFSLSPAPMSERVAGDQFGPIRLESYGTHINEAGLWVTVEWSAEDSIASNYNWFIHVS